MSKKILSLFFVLALIAGCSKEKVYKDNLQGDWQVYKYLFQNVDKTNQFNTNHPGYVISFTNDGKFSELVTTPDSAYTYGTYSFTNNDEKIVLENVYNTFSIDTAGDTTYIPHTVKRPYTIFNLTKDHVQLRNDTSQLYMEKLVVQ